MENTKRRKIERRRLGLMGGTFDPIHHGHLVTAEAARAHFGLDEVVFIPTGRPPHKPEHEVTDPEHRYLMCVLATATNPYFSVSRSEIDRPGPSFTVDTVGEFRESIDDSCGLFFITGADAVLEMLSWRDAKRLLLMTEVIAANRPGYRLSELSELQEGFSEEQLQVIHTLEVPALAISSSDIRKRVMRHWPIKYLVPEPVERYIDKHGLYGGGRVKGFQPRTYSKGNF